jgi:hypothetical protein
VRAVSPHLSSAQVADLLDERLEPGDRDTVITHLAACAECRHEVAELHGALSRVNERRPRTRWLAGASIAAAAVVAFVTVPRLTTRPVTLHETPSATRTAIEPSRIGSSARIAVVEPTEGALLSTAASFTWRSAGADASYLLTIQNAAGGVVFTTPATDTSAALPANVKLARGAKYFWSVDARLGDGGSSSSGAHVFTAR